MVVEADEYDYSFLWLRPKIADRSPMSTTTIPISSPTRRPTIAHSSDLPRMRPERRACRQPAMIRESSAMQSELRGWLGC